MRNLAAFVAGLLIAVPPVAGTEPAPPVTAQAPADLAGEIVLARPDLYKRMTVPVMIDGRGPYRFMIDTGAQATVVTRTLSDELKLRPLGRATVVGMASSASVDMVRLDGLEFAARVFDGLNVPLLEAQHIGADGILGLDSLQNLRVLIDFRTDAIAVHDAEQLGGNHGYEIIVRARSKLGRLIITNAEIDGIRTAVIVDTGAQGSMGNLALQRRMRSRSDLPSTTTDVLGNSIVGQLNYARALVIDRIQLNNIPITFADGPAFAALGLSKRPALILGMEELRLFDRVAIDFVSRKVLFDMPTQARAPGRLIGDQLPTRIES